MIARTFRLELRRSRTATVWLVAIAVLYAGIVGLFYPVIRDNSKALEDYMKIFPKGLLAGFGMTGSLADPGIFFSMYIGNMLWPILAAIAGILVATRALAADADRGWVDIPLATPLTRTGLALASIGGQVVVLGLLAVSTVGTVVVIGAVVGAGFDAGRFALASAPLLLFGCAVCGVASLISVLTLSRGVAAGATAGLLLIMYLLNVVAQIQPDLGWLADLSAFKYLSTTDTIDTGALSAAALLAFGGTALGAWILAVVAFRRRDLVA